MLFFKPKKEVKLADKKRELQALEEKIKSTPHNYDLTKYTLTRDVNP